MPARPPISAATRFCCVIGNPIGHSLSPALHNAAFEAVGADFVYTAFRVENVPAALAGMRALENFRGMSVTIPHKLAAMQTVDEVAAIDRRIGCINTVVNEGGRLIGFGTDGPGALKALTEAGVSLDGKQVLMLGAGGAARAIAFTLIDHGALAGLAILDVDAKFRDPLVADLKTAGGRNLIAGHLDEAAVREAMAQADLVIHCTPVGMHPKEDATLVPAEAWRRDQVAFDIVYTPLKTRLLKDAEAAGCTIIPGIEMFVNQAALQFERFTGLPAPVTVMRSVVLAKLCASDK